MKTLFKTTLFSLLLIFSWGNIFAQSVESILNNTVPELNGALKITPNKKYNKAQKEDYTKLYKKLDQATQDIKAYRMGALSEETAQVFDYKEIKKLGKDDLKIDSLETLIVNSMVAINDFMKWDEKFGASQAGAATPYTNYKDYYNKKDYDKAYEPWKYLFYNYPIITKSIYKSGVVLVKHKMSKAKTPEEKQAYFDTLFMVYDQQVKVSPKKEAYVLGRKTIDFYEFYVKGKDLNDSLVRIDLHKNFELANQAIEKGGQKTKYYIFPIAMKLTFFEFLLKTISAEQALDNYLAYSEILNNQITDIENSKDSPEKKKSKIDKIQKSGIALVDMIFTQSDLSTCEYIVPVFRKKFDDNPKDVKNLKKILTTLGQKGCTDSTLYSEVAIALYNVEPSAEYANNLGMLFASQEDYDKALTYFEEAINEEKVDTLKAKYYFSAAQVLNKQNKYSKTREYCRNSLKYNPNNGNAYILIATLYAATASSVGSDAFSRQAVYWVAVDKLIKAKSVDPSVAENANSLIGTYSTRYPKSEEGFMQGYPAGTPYTVGGWIGETTKARYND